MERKKSILGRITSGLKREFSVSRPTPPPTRERRDSDTLSICSITSVDPIEVDRLFPEAILYIDERLQSKQFSAEQRAQIVKEYLKRSQQGPSQSLLILKRLKRQDGTKPPSREVFTELRVLLRTEGVDWLKDFCKGKGLLSFGDAVLKDYIDDLLTDNDFQVTILSSLRSFSNNKYGVTMARDDPNVFLILLCLVNSTTAADDTVQSALQLLTVLCLLDPPHTHSRLVSAAMSCRLVCKQDVLFQGLVQHASTRRPQDTAFWVDYCIFMNAMVGTRDAEEEVELRIHLRSLLFRAQVATTIELLYTTTEHAVLLRQLDFFYSLLDSDREVMTERRKSSSDSAPLQDILDDLTNGTMIESVLRSLHAAPLSVQPSICLFLHSCLEELVIKRAGIHADFTLLPVFRVDMSSFVESFEEQQREKSEERLVELQKKLDHLQHQSQLSEVAFMDKVSKIKEEYEQRLKAAGGEIAELHRRLQVAQEQVSQVTQKMEKMTFDSVKEPISPISPVNPTSPTCTIPPPVMVVPPAPIAPVIQPIQSALAPPPPPPPPLLKPTTTGPPPPPALPLQSLKPRKAPTIKMRPLQWKKIPEIKLAGTIWYNMDDLKWEPQVDLNLLECRFGISTAQATPDHKQVASPLNNQCSFLSTKQSTNFEIALKRVKVPNLKDSLPLLFLQMDDSVFEHSLVSELVKLDCSEQTRQQAIAMADSIQSAAESYLVSLFKVPAYELRLRVFQLQGGFEEWSQSVRKVPFYCFDSICSQWTLYG